MLDICWGKGDIPDWSAFGSNQRPYFISHILFTGHGSLYFAGNVVQIMQNLEAFLFTICHRFNMLAILHLLNNFGKDILIQVQQSLRDATKSSLIHKKIALS